MKKIIIFIYLLIFLLCLPSCREKDIESQPTPSIFINSGTPWDQLPQQIKDIWSEEAWENLPEPAKGILIENFYNASLFTPPPMGSASTPEPLPSFEEIVRLADLIVIAKYEDRTWTLDNEREKYYHIKNQFTLEQVIIGEEPDRMLSVGDFGVMDTTGVLDARYGENYVSDMRYMLILAEVSDDLYGDKYRSWGVFLPLTDLSAATFVKDYIDIRKGETAQLFKTPITESELIASIQSLRNNTVDSSK